MTARRPGRTPRLAAGTCALAAALTLVPALSPAPGVGTSPSLFAAPLAAAADLPTAISITRAQVNGDTLTIEGSVTNNGRTALRDMTAYLWRSSSLIRSPEAVDAAVRDATTTPGTADPAGPDNTDLLLTTGDTLKPGESATFRVSGSVQELGLAASDTSYWVGVDVHGRVGTQSLQALGVERTLVTRTASDVPVATVVELSTQPRLLKTNLFVDDTLADALSTGDLAQLLDVAKERDTDWVVDAGLLEEVRDMADGYRVQGESGSTPGTRADVAAAWLTELAQLPADRGGVGLVGTPDLASAAQLGDAAIRNRAAVATDAVEASPTRQFAIVNRPDAGGVRLAGDSNRTVVALDVTAPSPWVSAEDASVLVATTAAAPIENSPVLRDTDLNRRLLQAAQARARGGLVRWLRSPADAAATSAPLQPGFAAVPLSQVMAGTPVAWAPPPRRPVASAVNVDTIRTITALGPTLASYGEAAPESGIGPVADAAVARAASARWPDQAAQERWVDALKRRLNLPDGNYVSLTASPRFTMTGAESDFPVTISNRLSDPVTVAVSTATDNPQRIRFVDSAPVTIAPGTSATVHLRAIAAGSGVVKAKVFAATQGGHRLTPDTEITVDTTNAGLIGWVLVIVSGIVLVVSTALRIRQVRARQKKGVHD